MSTGEQDGIAPALDQFSRDATQDDLLNGKWR